MNELAKVDLLSIFFPMWNEEDYVERAVRAAEEECQRLIDLFKGFEDKNRFPVLAAYDQVLKCSNLFNLLDARGAISVTERVGVIGRVRKLAVGVAQLWMAQQAAAIEEVAQ